MRNKFIFDRMYDSNISDAKDPKQIILTLLFQVSHLINNKKKWDQNEIINKRKDAKRNLTINSNSQRWEVEMNKDMG